MHIDSDQFGMILFAIIVLIMVLVSAIMRRNKLLDSKKKLLTELEKVNFKLNSAIDKEKSKLDSANKKLAELNELFDTIEVHSVLDANKKLKEINDGIEEGNIRIHDLRENISQMESKRDILIAEITEHEDKDKALEKKIENQKIKFQKNRELYTAMTTAMQSYYKADIRETGFRPLSHEQMRDIDSLAPSVLLNLNAMNYQDLRKKLLDNQKQIQEVYEGFIDRYTTKGTQSLYQVMIIALSAELQNILTKLRYGKLDEGITAVHDVVNKFIAIAEAGNQTISGTVKQFAYTIERLFENAVNIEYEYYIKKEQARQEQLALKARMREEREEQRRLAEQAEQMKKEEEKYLLEKERLEAKLDEAADEEERGLIESDLAKLNESLNAINEKKEEITKLQHGKAGNVYIISNLGSFGDDVFKIGMTRRLDPQERVDELGSASVPFEFDVHSFIFSEDAAGLEAELHRRLNNKRVNKVNRRKEFFSVSLDELEKLVNEIYPSAEFNRTMLAEEYRQSLSLSDNAFSIDENTESQSYV